MNNPSDSPSSMELLAQRIAVLTQPIQHRLGAWEVHPTSTGAILTMSQCGLGDAAFLPQAMVHGGLELRKAGFVETREWLNQTGQIVVGEIRWPVDSDDEDHQVVTPPDTPLKPDAAAPQAFSMLAHTYLRPPAPTPAIIGAKLERFLAKKQYNISCKWWQGIATDMGRGRQLLTLNVHLSTRQEELLSPYQFEKRVLPVLRGLAKLSRQDGLLVRIDNPSTNYVVFCAAADSFLPKGTPCPAGQRHEV